jgi:hypothetical protein
MSRYHSSVQPQQQRLESTVGFVTCDARHLPYAVARWNGRVDAALVGKFDQWLGQLFDHLETEQLRGVLVADISATEQPDGEARRALVAMRAAKLQRSRELLVTDFVVVHRPLQRAVMQTLHWIAPHQQSTVVPSLDEALRRAHEELTRAGIAAPRVTAFEFEGPWL